MNNVDSEGELAAKISATKDNIDDGQYKALVEDCTTNKQYPTEFIQKNADIIKPSLSKPTNIFITEGEDLAAVPHNSGLDDINTKPSSLQYQKDNAETDGYRYSDGKNKSHACSHACHRNVDKNILSEPTDIKTLLVNTKKTNSLTDDVLDKHTSQSRRKYNLTRLKTFHFPGTQSVDNCGESLPSTPQTLSLNRFFERNKITFPNNNNPKNVLDMSSRRSNRPSHGNSQHNMDAPQSFDFDQMQKALSETGSENTHSSNRSGERHRQYTPPSSGEQSRTSSRQHSQRHMYQQQQTNEIQVVSGPSVPLQSLQVVSENNGANNVHTVPSSSNGTKKDKYKGLWGKVGKHGMSQAAAQRSNEGETASPSSTVKAPSKKWDQVLNPLIQKQSKQQDKKLAKKQSKAEINFHMQQQQLQQTGPMPTAAAGGSYVFSETSGTGTVECDCGDDSCPNCNLLLQMSGSGW